MKTIFNNKKREILQGVYKKIDYLGASSDEKRDLLLLSEIELIKKNGDS